MALTDKTYTAVHNKTGSGKQKLQDEFDAGYLSKIADIPDKEPALAALVYQIGLLQDEIDYLRTEISANKDKVIPNVTGTTNHAISFGALKTTLVKGKPVYSVVMTVTDSSGAKVVAKTITLTLT